MASGFSPTQAVWLNAVAGDTFAANGLDISGWAIGGLDTQAVIAAMLTGDADLAYIGPAAVLAANAGGADLMFMGAGTGPQITVYVNSDTDAARLGRDAPLEQRLQALKGLTVVSASAGSTSDQAFRSLLRSAGVDPDNDLTIIHSTQYTTYSQGLEEGQYDAAATVPGFGMERNVAEGTAIVLVSMLEGDGGEELAALSGSVIARREWVEENPDLAEAVYQSLSDSAAAYRTDPDRFLQTIRDEFYADMDTELFDLMMEPIRTSLEEGDLANIVRSQYEALRSSVGEGETDVSQLAYDEYVYASAQTP